MGRVRGSDSAGFRHSPCARTLRAGPRRVACDLPATHRYRKAFSKRFVLQLQLVFSFTDGHGRVTSQSQPSAVLTCTWACWHQHPFLTLAAQTLCSRVTIVQPLARVNNLADLADLATLQSFNHSPGGRARDKSQPRPSTLPTCTWARRHLFLTSAVQPVCVQSCEQPRVERGVPGRGGAQGVPQASRASSTWESGTHTTWVWMIS